MKIRVMYHSRSGNTKKLAEAIAKTAGQPSEAVPPAYPLENVKLLFLGAGIYKGKPDNKIKEFIGTLNQNRVKNVALFGTAGGGESEDGALKQIKQLFKEKGINVLEETFLCKGKAFIFFNRGCPRQEDLKAAQEFAAKAIEKLKE